MPIFKYLRNAIGAARTAPVAVATLDMLLQVELSRELERLQDKAAQETPGNPAADGFKVYSQADEDGILEAIFERLGIGRGSFVEIGCGTGLENNTHYLLLKGWRGIWVDGDPANIAAIRTALPPSERLRVVEAMVDRETAPSLVDEAALEALGGLDLLSVDIDGNDLDVVVACASAWRPKVVIVEYNAKFPPPTVVHIAYDPAHRWNRDDYHGASLGAFIARLSDYRLVSCNLAGTNAFFVRLDLAAMFADHPARRLYQPARFHLTALRSGHAPTRSYLRRNLEAPR